MKKIIVRGGTLLAIMLALAACQEVPPELSEIQPDWVPIDDGRYLPGLEYPWSRPLDDCMGTGRTRTECFASLPPELLEQFEAWEAEQAAVRRQLTRRRLPGPGFGVAPE